MSNLPVDIAYLQGYQKSPAAGENHHLLGSYQPATLLGISLQMAFCK